MDHLLMQRAGRRGKTMLRRSPPAGLHRSLFTNGIFRHIDVKPGDHFYLAPPDRAGIW
jgi:hypothetical protein